MLDTEWGAMAKSTSRFVCQSCGAISPKWAGRCESCGEWNSIVEEAVVRPGPAGKATAGRRVEFVGMAGSAFRPESPNWTGCWAAVSCKPPQCWSAAILASASPP